MDATAVGFLILMSLAGGAVAWVADVLGYKIGKKKLSLWHIRPRHVARISVVLAGMLIPLIAFGIYFAISASFRQWVTEGQRAIIDAQEKSRQLEKVKNEVADAQNQLRVTSNERDQIQKERERISKEIVEQRKKQTELKAKLDQLGPQIANLQTKVTQLTRQDEQLRIEKTKNLASLKQVQKDLKESQDKLADSKRQFGDAKSRLDQTQLQNLRLTNQNAALESKNKELDVQIVELQKQVPDLVSQVATLKTSKTLAEADVKAAEEKIKSLNQQLAEVSLSTKNMLEQYSAVAKLQPVTFRRGEEVGRVAIVPKMSEADRRTAYRGLIRHAKSIATSRGAEPDRTYPFTGAAGFIITDSDNQALSEDQVEDYWVQRFGAIKQEQVAIVTSATNCFGTESVLLKLDVYPNPLVFRKGEIVAETQFDPRTTDSEIRANIREFLRTFVNTKARSRKMIPNGESYGELSEDQYFTAFMRARTITRVVRMVAVAQDDIRAGDSLNVNLEFR